MKQDELLIKLFNEVAYVWPRVRLSTVGDSVQPVCEEPFHDERNGHGEGQRTLGYDCR